MNLALMGDAANVDWVREDLVDVTPAEGASARRPPRPIDADGNPEGFGIEDPFKGYNTPDLQIPLEDCPHDRGMLFDNA